MSEMTPLQYGSRSPDGRWWWDGQAWQPVPAGAGQGPPGQVRSIPMCFVLTIVTLFIYTFYWVYKTQDEIKQHSDVGVGGGIGLLIYIFVSPVTFFLVANDVNEMHKRRGLQSRVSVLTGLWILLPLIGHIIWFVKVQGTLNDYWTLVGTPQG